MASSHCDLRAEVGGKVVVVRDLVTNIFLPMSGTDQNCGSSSKNSFNEPKRQNTWLVVLNAVISVRLTD